MLDPDEVLPGLYRAIASDDKTALWRGLNDLMGAGVTDITIKMELVTMSGKRIETELSFLSQKTNIITPMTKAEKIIFRRRLIEDGNRLEQNKSIKNFKHRNEMSPEEFAWVMEFE